MEEPIGILVRWSLTGGGRLREVSLIGILVRLSLKRGGRLRERCSLREIPLYFLFLAPPSMDKCPESPHRVNETSALVVFCNATGIPKPNITWRTYADNDRGPFPPGETLRLENVSRSDDGSYECWANNKIGYGTRCQFKVKVNCKYRFLYGLALKKGSPSHTRHEILGFHVTSP